MVEMEVVVRQLSASAAAIRALVEGVSAEQAEWQPDAESWSLKQVMEHVDNTERLDFRLHLQEIFHEPPLGWGGLSLPYQAAPDCATSLSNFLREREASIAWLRGLAGVDWDAYSEATFGPNAEKLTMSAGNLLYAWVAHDYLHIRQINELLFAWNAQQARPYSVEYAGGW